MYTIYKTASFESAHLLEGHPKCGKLHGHSYKLEVWIKAEQLIEPYNFVLDFHTISDIVKLYDHSNVIITISCEELAEEITGKIIEEAKKVQQDDISVRVRLWETATSYAEYQN